MTDTLVTNLSVITIISFAFIMVLHIFYSIATYKLMQYHEYEYSYLSFVPLLNTYLTASISDRIIMNKNNKNSNLKSIIKILNLAYIGLIIILIPVLSSIISQAIMNNKILFFSNIMLSILFLFTIVLISIRVFLIISLYHIYKEYSPYQAIIFTLVSILFWWITPFLFFSVVNIKTNLK